MSEFWYNVFIFNCKNYHVEDVVCNIVFYNFSLRLKTLIIILVGKCKMFVSISLCIRKLYLDDTKFGILSKAKSLYTLPSLSQGWHTSKDK